MRIFDANRDQLSDPDKIKPGQVLKIPQPAKLNRTQCDVRLCLRRFGAALATQSAEASRQTGSDRLMVEP
jgi:LysM repeat protein